MRVLILSLAVLLASCATAPVPVKQKFPDAPKELFEKCPQLLTIEPGTTAITDILKVVVKNYQTYYACAVTTEGWTDWYKIQKDIYNGVSK